MVRRRSLLALLATGSFLSFFAYYLLMHRIHSNVYPDYRQDFPPNSVQARLVALERELRANQQLLSHVRKRVIQVARSFPPNRSKDLQVGIPSCHPPLEATVDVRLQNVYEEVSFENTDGGVWRQGWPVVVDDERRSRPLQVFVVPHSHNDPGWIKTVDAYFKGQTRHILNNMLAFLSQNPEMRFIWAETSYFALWWETLAPEEKEQVRSLLRKGQLEMVTGGWVMNDEANTHLQAIVAQMVEGHEWLMRTVGVIPRFGWAIDPFGMSPTMAYVLKKMGMKGMVVQRVHYSIKKYLAKNHLLEFYWRQFWEADDPSDDILAHVMPFFSYDVPHSCGPDPMVCCQFDFRRMTPFKANCPWKKNPREITEANVAERAALLADQYWKKAMLFKRNAILVPLGKCFTSRSSYFKCLFWC